MRFGDAFAVVARTEELAETNVIVVHFDQFEKSKCEDVDDDEDLCVEAEPGIDGWHVEGDDGAKSGS